MKLCAAPNAQGCLVFKGVKRLPSFVVVQVSGRTDPWIALRAGAMYFYCIGMWTRAEDPRNRTYADPFPFTYPPSGRRGQHICFTYFGLHIPKSTWSWKAQNNVVTDIMNLCVYVQLTSLIQMLSY